MTRTPDVDDLAVRLVVDDGHDLPLNGPERRRAATILTARGCSVAEIAERLHITTRTVNRWRADDDQDGPPDDD
jgi:DNA-binding NarL/FixJ family response regulator